MCWNRIRNSMRFQWVHHQQTKKISSSAFIMSSKPWFCVEWVLKTPHLTKAWLPSNLRCTCWKFTNILGKIEQLWGTAILTNSNSISAAFYPHPTEIHGLQSQVILQKTFVSFCHCYHWSHDIKMLSFLEHQASSMICFSEHKCQLDCTFHFLLLVFLLMQCPCLTIWRKISLYSMQPLVAFSSPASVTILFI